MRKLPRNRSRSFFYGGVLLLLVLLYGYFALGVLFEGQELPTPPRPPTILSSRRDSISPIDEATRSISSSSSSSGSPTQTTTSTALDPSILPQLWPDLEHVDAPPSFDDALATGLLQNNTMPYPSNIEDDPEFYERFHDSEEYIDSPWITREDLRHVPTVYDIGMESFADVRLTTFTVTGVFIGLEERKGLFEYQQQQYITTSHSERVHTSEPKAASETNTSSAHPLSDIPLEAEAGADDDSNSNTSSTSSDIPAAYTPTSETPQQTVPQTLLHQALEVDHERLEPFYSYEYIHQQHVIFRSASNATAPRAPPPVSEMMTRMAMGDSVYDPLGVQIQDRFFAFERNMDYYFRNYMCERFIELMHVPNRPPLVIHMNKMIPFQFVVRCLYFRTNALSTAKRKFVFLTTEVDETPTYNFFVEADLHPADFNKEAGVVYVLNHPLLAHWYSTNGNIRHPKFTSIPIGFQFHYRSLAGTLMPYDRNFRKEDEVLHSNYTSHFVGHVNLSLMFPHLDHKLEIGAMGSTWLENALEVFCGETVDPPVEVIPLDMLPQRITTVYFVSMPIEKRKRANRPSLTNEVIIFREPTDPDKPGPASAQHIVLLPYTSALYHHLLQTPHGSDDREAKVVTAFTIWQWRWHWFDVLNHTNFGVFPKEDTGKNKFLQMLHSYSFVLSPPGNGYECFRTWESVALGAIPIVQNPVVLERVMHVVGGPEELDIGPEVNSRALLEPYRHLPVVYVDKPEDITEDRLYQWRREIYQRGKQRKYKFEKLFMQYWVDKIYGHTNDD